MTVYGPKVGKNGRKWSYFGFIWNSSKPINVVSIQQLDNVVCYRLRNLNRGRCAQIWHKSPKPRQNWVAAGRKSRSRQFLDGSVTGFRYLIKILGEGHTPTPHSPARSGRVQAEHA